jgi:DNA polymerase-4
MRHSIVMSKNALAKRFGIPTGIAFRQARQLCPALHYVKADMSKYLKETRLSRMVFSKYSSSVTPYGMDEAWLDLGTLPLDEAAQIAELLRVEIYYSLGLSAGLGVADNLIYSKIASDLKKPNAVTLITPENVREKIYPLPASNLLFVGREREKILLRAGLSTIGDVACTCPDFLQKLLGKAGRDLWHYANGNDAPFVPNTDEIGSIGNTITPPADLRTSAEVSAVLYLLATAVCARLHRHGLSASCISITMRDSSFNKFSRQTSLKISTNDVNYVFNRAFELFQRHYKWERSLRSIGIRVDSLDGMGQLTLPGYETAPIVDVDRRVRELTARLGTLEVERSLLCADAIQP